MKTDRVALLHKVGFTKDTEVLEPHVNERKALVQKLVILEAPPAQAQYEQMVAKATSGATAFARDEANNNDDDEKKKAAEPTKKTVKKDGTKEHVEV